MFGDWYKKKGEIIAKEALLWIPLPLK